MTNIVKDILITPTEDIHQVLILQKPDQILKNNN